MKVRKLFLGVAALGLTMGLALTGCQQQGKKAEKGAKKTEQAQPAAVKQAPKAQPEAAKAAAKPGA